MTEHTLDVNGKRYELSSEFKRAIQQRAKNEYRRNKQFSCWWKTNEDGHPTLVIETTGKIVPWDNLDQLEMRMDHDPQTGSRQQDDSDETEEVDSGNGMKEVKPPDEHKEPRDVDFGRTHFSLTPARFDEVPNPSADDPEKIPPKPDEVDEEMMVLWVPKHPDIDEVWSTGEAITAMNTWTEWDVQAKANQPRPIKDKPNSHDAIESLCRIHNCEVVGTAKPSNDIPEKAGQVERKGEGWYNGDEVGDRWHI